MEILFWVLIVALIFCSLGAFTSIGKQWQHEYFAFRTTQNYMHSKGLKWPPNEKWSCFGRYK